MILLLGHSIPQLHSEMTLFGWLIFVTVFLKVPAEICSEPARLLQSTHTSMITANEMYQMAQQSIWYCAH